MPGDFIPFGEPYPDLNPDHLTLPIAKRTLSVCYNSKDFEAVELRRLQLLNGVFAEIIVVDCVNDQIGSKNQFGIKVRERLALVFLSKEDQMPEVRALRRDFPLEVLHLNYYGPRQPVGLCLYIDTWTGIERTWTPQKFLKRIFWWLTETAKGTLHLRDQPLEQMYYFEGSFELILPPDFDDKIKDKTLSLIPILIERSVGGFKIIRGLFIRKDQAQANQLPEINLLTLSLPPVVHSGPQPFPNTLGQVHDQFSKRGAAFFDLLCNLIREKAAGQGLDRRPLGRCLLLLHTPLKRTPDSEPERYESRAFLLPNDLTTLGESIGALILINGKYYAIPILGESKSKPATAWRDIEVMPIDVKSSVDQAFARAASGLNPQTAQFEGVLAGVGALGSSLSEIWAKEAWGRWTFIDGDIVKAHNTIRHIAKDWQIGQFKVDAVKEIVESTYHDGYYTSQAIPESISNWLNPQFQETVRSANLLIDSTTTLEVPRDLSQKSDAPRSISVFLTPSGTDSVLLLENIDRSLRLDSLEAQYYRAILNNPWGKDTSKVTWVT
ncbi:MAG: ThiF family adenylyltransferase [Candidatus Manganitrophus sp.]|nr:MAG: ThiF family adenylyltransferase [Candidatus Manganitrophus sp.]